MRRRLIASYLLLVFSLLVLLELPLAISYHRSARRDLAVRVERDAVSFATLADDGLESSASKTRAATVRGIQPTASRYARDTGGRVVIVDKDGKLLLDTAASPPVPRGAARSFASRPELARALTGTTATGSRASRTLGYDLLYVAVPVASGGSVHGAIRITYPLRDVDRRIYQYWLVLAGIGVLAALTALVAALLFARWALRPLSALVDTTHAVRAGDLSARVPAEDGPVELRELGREFNRMIDELDRLVTAQNQFVADASHQLRTPLTALRLSLESAASRPTDSTEQTFSSALDEVDRLGRIVEGLLVLARTDGVAAPVVPIDVAAIARDRSAAWEGLAAERDVRMVVDAPEAAMAEAVDGTIEQVIDNLVDNALESAPGGSTITIGVHDASRVVHLDVIDDGPGMTDAQIDQAFERFWQGSSDRSGSGLGLAIVRRLLSASGGSIEIAHATGEGRGIKASVTLPHQLRPGGSE